MSIRLSTRLSTVVAQAAISRNAQLPAIRTWFKSRTPNVESNRIAALFDASLPQPMLVVQGTGEKFDLEAFRTTIEALLNQVAAEVEHIRQDGLTFSLSEITAMFGRLLTFILPTIRSLPITPEDRRLAALLVADEFYVKVIAPLDLPWIPDIAENNLVDPYLGRAWHEAAAGLYDFLDQFVFTEIPNGVIPRAISVEAGK